LKLKHDRYRLTDNDSPSGFAACLKSLGDVDNAPARTVKTRFFDTFDWRLFDNKVSVCVGSGERDPQVSISNLASNKTVATIHSDLPTGFASDFPEGRIRDLMNGFIDVRRLLPRLDVTSRQTPITLRDKEGKVVLRIGVEKCRVQIPGRARTVALGTYLTLQPVRGYAKIDTKARALLQTGFALHPCATPLFIEGFKALGVCPGDYSSRLRLDLDQAMTSNAAARQVHLTLLNTMTRNEDGIAANTDPEFLHDFRVAVRRTRSALGQLDKGVLPAAVIAKARKDFRWIGQQTNQMRDLDVYLIDYPILRSALPNSYKSYLQPFQDYLIAQSRKESRRLAAMIRGKRYLRIRDNWRGYLTEGFKKDKKAVQADMPVKYLANDRIWKAYRRVMKEGGMIDNDSPAEALHAFRITCKKLRYFLEFFRNLYPPREFGKLVKSLKHFQDVLGEFQDTEVQSLAILNFGRLMALAGVAPTETQMAMGMVAESILLRQGAARSMFFKRFEAFSRSAVKASFAKLFKNKE